MVNINLCVFSCFSDQKRRLVQALRKNVQPLNEDLTKLLLVVQLISYIARYFGLQAQENETLITSSVHTHIEKHLAFLGLKRKLICKKLLA